MPVDFNATPGTWQLLFDFELNRLLADIVTRTSNVTVVLDCCNSAGATREVLGAGLTPRALDFTSDSGRADPIVLSPDQQALAAAGVRGVAGNVDDCHVVAACLDHEQAQEYLGNGLLTRALTQELASLPDASIREVIWSRVWQAVRARVETANPTQHVWMAGSLSRAWLAGKPVDADAGLTVERQGTANAYTLGAGTLAGVTEGAKVAVYGATPPYFPPLGSDKDKAARLSDSRFAEILSGTRGGVAKDLSNDTTGNAPPRAVDGEGGGHALPGLISTGSRVVMPDVDVRRRRGASARPRARETHRESRRYGVGTRSGGRCSPEPQRPALPLVLRCRRIATIAAGSSTSARHNGSELVHGGQKIQSSSDKMVCTLGQPTQIQEKISSDNFSIRGGLIGATGSTP